MAKRKSSRSKKRRSGKRRTLHGAAKKAHAKRVARGHYKTTKRRRKRSKTRRSR